MSARRGDLRLYLGFLLLAALQFYVRPRVWDGRVTGVRAEELGWERIYRLAPIANPGHVAHVLVVRSPAGPEPGQ